MNPYREPYEYPLAPYWLVEAIEIADFERAVQPAWRRVARDFRHWVARYW